MQNSINIDQKEMQTKQLQRRKDNTVCTDHVNQFSRVIAGQNLNSL
jgi:hypothetical protein